MWAKQMVEIHNASVTARLLLLLRRRGVLALSPPAGGDASAAPIPAKARKVEGLLLEWAALGFAPSPPPPPLRPSARLREALTCPEPRQRA